MLATHRFLERDRAWAANARTRRNVLAALGACLWLALAALRGGGDPMQPDSLSYLEFQPHRTAGYPLFLAGLRAIGLEPAQIVLIQAAGLAAAAAAFAASLARYARSLVLAAGMLAAILGHPLLGGLAFSIVTESLFAAALMLAARAALDGRWLWLGLWTGVALSVRPTGWALMPAATLAVLAIDGEVRTRLARAAAIVGICLTCALAGNLAQRAWAVPGGGLDFGRFSLLGRALLETPRPQLDALGLGGLAPRLDAVRATLERAPDWRTRYLLNAVYYNRLLWEAALPALDAKRAEIGDEAFSRAVDAALGAAVAENGASLLAMSARDLASLWILGDLMTRAEAAEQMRTIESLGALPELGAYPYSIGGRSPFVVWPLRAILALAFLASLVLPVLTWRRPSGILFMALAAHGAFALTALANTGLPRYAAVVWPLQIALCVLALAHAKNRHEPPIDRAG